MKRILCLFLLAATAAFADSAKTLPVGSPETIKVVVASGTQPFSYQWFKNGVAIAGATSASVSWVGVQLADAGTYTVMVSNAYGNTMSDKAVLTVTPPTPPAGVPPSGATTSM